MNMILFNRGFAAAPPPACGLSPLQGFALLLFIAGVSLPLHLLPVVFRPFGVLCCCCSLQGFRCCSTSCLWSFTPSGLCAVVVHSRGFAAAPPPACGLSPLRGFVLLLFIVGAIGWIFLIGQIEGCGTWQMWHFDPFLSCVKTLLGNLIRFNVRGGWK